VIPALITTPGIFESLHETGTMLPSMLHPARYQNIAVDDVFGVLELSQLQEPRTSSKAI